MGVEAKERQRAHRQRQAQRTERMYAALISIRDALKGNDKPLAVKLRALAEEGLQ